MLWHSCTKSEAGGGQEQIAGDRAPTKSKSQEPKLETKLSEAQPLVSQGEGDTPTKPVLIEEPALSFVPFPLP